MKAYRGSGGITPLSLGTVWRLEVNITPRPPYPLEMTQVCIEEEVGWASETFWRRENRFVPVQIRTLDLF
jgi:hypothetical protein